MLKKVSCSKIGIFATSAILATVNAHAAFTLPLDADVDMGPVEAVMALIAVGLLGMWGIRKFIKTVNRS